MIVVGTSLAVYPAASLVRYIRPEVPVFLVDPGLPDTSGIRNPVEHIRAGAAQGMPLLADRLIERTGVITQREMTISLSPAPAYRVRNTGDGRAAFFPSHDIRGSEAGEQDRTPAGTADSPQPLRIGPKSDAERHRQPKKKSVR